MKDNYLVGIDVGSTTVKLVIVDKDENKVVYSKYERHNAKQEETLKDILNEVKNKYSDISFKAAVCGSGGLPISKKLGVHHIQEVVANAAAVTKNYPNVRTAIELGGQDAKVVFFYYDKKTNSLMTSDMRMNGSCAGGTGAFIDEIATLLNIKTEEFNDLASKGKNVYDISGRCGVFAKTDIQPLLIQGANKEDVALSTFHALAKQVIGGLSQGLELAPPIIFEGGPLTFNPRLIDVFAEKLNLKTEDIIIPEKPETFVAYGCAVAIEDLFKDSEVINFDTLFQRINENKIEGKKKEVIVSKPFFENDKEKEDFINRHKAELKEVEEANIINNKLRVYLGIDSGSTTSKFVFMDENMRVIDRFYANNLGSPLDVVKNGFLDIIEKYKSKGIDVEILGLGTTGYGEMTFAKAFGADYHIVETVAHEKGCQQFYKDVSFILDIGGQDMKAIWINDGTITNIMLNEACSSGCGSFLENFATNLSIPVTDIADKAFASKTPATLGSRCTVFMNSTIITEQRDKKSPEDIMAGLCRSIIENVFTKVVRISNVDELGNKIVVQGGTFKNFAVLKAFEDYVQKDVFLAPYPGEMGAIGAAILAKEQIEEYGYKNGKSTSFIGIDGVKNFSYKTEIGVKCELCQNHCARTVMHFSNGNVLVTGNRCEKGEFLLEKNDNVKEALDKLKAKNNAIDMFEYREQLLFKNYNVNVVGLKKNKVIGIPRVLEFWDSAAFWKSFFEALGYDVVYSDKSTMKMYEEGLKFVASDTICFPAKLVHGHIKNLADKKVDMIFMPYIMHMPPEGKNKLSPYVCSVVMGYPMVVKNSQDPEKVYGIHFESPIFHWFSVNDRKKQIIKYAIEKLNVNKREAIKAFKIAEGIILEFRNNLKEKAQEIIKVAKNNNEFAVVLAGRPYHTDSFVSHSVSKNFTSLGISVITADSLPGLSDVDLKNTRAEITNNFHTRMLESALIASYNNCLEYCQIVSFGCGHDAILSDEIIRIITSTSNKSPLILKMDESAASGALKIRVHSFVESVKIRRKNLVEEHTELKESSPVKFYKKDKKIRTLLIPNISKGLTVILNSLLEKEGFIVRTVPVGSIEQIKIGKKYVHNDICFPAQMVIGELISEIKNNNYKQDEVAVGMVKFQCDCRMSHYASLLRKGLDAAGLDKVPILTTDVNDTKDMHPGVFLLNIPTVYEVIWGAMMLDILTDLCRKTRPYELNIGQTDRVYNECINRIGNALKVGVDKALKEFEMCINEMANIKYDRTNQKPIVFITGELLVKYHPGTNFHIEEYLENNGMETKFPRMTDQLRKDFLATMSEIKDYNANIFPYPFAIDFLFDHVQKKLEVIAKKHPLYKCVPRPRDLYNGVEDIIPKTLSCGEGWLMAAEISHYAKEGVKSFVILQPFGCLPNHITGRGVIKKLKEKYPDIQILPLDLDPDTSFANVENRLQMLIMNNNQKRGEIA